jgi:hypothetical protein
MIAWIHLPASDFATFTSAEQITRWMEQYGRVYAFIIGPERAARA